MSKNTQPTQSQKLNLIALLENFDKALRADAAFKKYIAIMDASDAADYEPVQTHNLLHFIDDVRGEVMASQFDEA